MFKYIERAIEHIRENVLIYLVLLSISGFWTTWSVYYSISQDCRVLGAFRVGNIGFHCQVAQS